MIGILSHGNEHYGKTYKNINLSFINVFYVTFEKKRQTVDYIIYA